MDKSTEFTEWKIRTKKQCKIFIDIEGATKIHLTSISAAIAHINYIRFLIVDSVV